jgi:hypothetical protein
LHVEPDFAPGHFLQGHVDGVPLAPGVDGHGQFGVRVGEQALCWPPSNDPFFFFFFFFLLFLFRLLLPAVRVLRPVLL